jgi:hypothetical protein
MDAGTLVDYKGAMVCDALVGPEQRKGGMLDLAHKRAPYTLAPF